MPSTSVRLAPGVNSVKTPSLNEAGVSTSNLIRYREGLIEKRGGWLKYFASALSGIPRAIWPWRDFQNTTFVAVGTTTNLYAIANNVATDVTPRTLISTLTNCFTNGNNFVSNGIPGTFVGVIDPSYTPANAEVVTVQDLVSVGGVAISGSYKTQNAVIPSGTNYALIVFNKTKASTETATAHLPTYATTNGSPTVTVTLTAHNMNVGDQFSIQNAVTVGGLTIVGAQTVASVTGANTFTLQLDAVATSTASAGPSSVNIVYNPTNMYGTAPKGTQITTRDWSLGNYGQLLIACPYQGAIYQWQTSGALSNANIIAGSPLATGIVISDAAQQIIAYGGNPLSLYDPNFVAWCDTANITQWTAAIGNQAGSFRIPTGSGIQGAATVASSIILLWTDVDVWSMNYVGYPLVYSFNKLAVGCGLIAQFGWAKFGTYTFWMSQKRFWFYDGNSVQPLDCPVYDNVFPQISAANAWKIRGATNSQFNEVMWLFPSAGGSGENDTYVCFNPIENAWDYGSMPRSAWTDQSVAGSPLGADPSGFLYQHETSPDAAGVAMTPSFTTGLAQINEGEDFLAISRIRPDFKFPTGVGTISVTVYAYKYPGDTPVVKGPYTFTQATEYISTRCRGRYIALGFSANDLGSFWRIGRNEVQFTPDGRR